MRSIIAILMLILAAVPITAQRRIATHDFILLESAQFGADVLDVESTQRCIRKGTCREGNPMMGQSRIQEYAMSMGETAAMTVVAYELKKHGVRKWWLAPTFEISMHGGLAGLNMRF